MRSRITKLYQRIQTFGGRPYVRIVGGVERWLAKHQIEVNRNVSPPRLALYAPLQAPSFNSLLKRPPQPTGLFVTQMGRFGNSFQQVCNVIRLAHSTGVSRVYLEPTQWLRHEFTTGLGVDVCQLSKGNHSEVRSGELGVGRFLWGNEFIYAKPSLTEAQISSELRRNLSFQTRSLDFGERDLVIHLRGGDVYNSDPPRDYGQPPAGFYDYVIRSFSWDSVTVVHEDDKPVVLPRLRGIANTLGVPFRFQSGSLKDDLSVLLAAKNLVVGNGSFARAVCQLSSDLRTVYRLNGTYPIGELASGKTEELVIDSRGQFFDKVLQRNWQNNDEQRALMLSYPATNFRIENASEGIGLSKEGKQSS